MYPISTIRSLAMKIDYKKALRYRNQKNNLEVNVQSCFGLLYKRMT